MALSRKRSHRMLYRTKSRKDRKSIKKSMRGGVVLSRTRSRSAVSTRDYRMLESAMDKIRRDVEKLRTAPNRSVYVKRLESCENQILALRGMIQIERDRLYESGYDENDMYLINLERELKSILPRMIARLQLEKSRSRK